MKKGFTLIELLIVIAIIAILALIAIPNFLEAQVRSKVARGHADMRQLAAAIEAYFTDYNAYPVDNEQANKAASYYKVYTSMAADLQCLREPVMYINSQARAFMDPFESDNTGVDRSYRFNNIVGAVQYVRAKGAGMDWAAWSGGGNHVSTSAYWRAPAPLRFNGTGATAGKLYNANWTLAGSGPDRTRTLKLNTTGGNRTVADMFYGRDRYEDFCLGETNFYDPTNGTVSEGNVWRFSGGGMD